MRQARKEWVMKIHIRKERPAAWAERRSRTKRAWFLPFVALEWLWEWVAYALSNWTFLEVLDYLETFSVLFAVIFYFSESGDRVKQRHYQAWQVVNTSQGKGGSGGRIEALQELNADHVPLVGVDVSSAFLQGLDLNHASLLRADFSSADLRNSTMAGCDFTLATLNNANLRSADLNHAVFVEADLRAADLTGANLSDSDPSGAQLDGADLRSANLRNMRWQQIRSIEGATIADVRNAPPGFVSWAVAHGAVQSPVTNP